jgi:iron(III) transport system ATP-binding protein
VEHITSKEVIRIRSLSMTYPGSSRQAVYGLDLTVREGEIITLLGPSGCGKTTVLRLVAGLEIPNEGEIYINGQKVSSAEKSLPPEKRGLGMVFQNYALFPHMTAFENISFALFKQPKKVRRQRTEEVMELVGLTSFAERYPHELSGGQQQRIALARALAAKPAVILPDEPFSHLDE